MMPDLPSFTTLMTEMAAPKVLLVTLNRPDFANAFNTEMAEELTVLFEMLNLDAGDIRAVVLTGAGERAFCAGGDLKERYGMSDAAWFAQHRIYERMARAIIGLPLPLIGAVNGVAYGGGCELASACDFIYAAEGARFAQTEVRLGIIPGAAGTQLLARAVGERRAKEIIMSGKPFSAGDAAAWGLFSRVLPSAPAWIWGLPPACFSRSRPITAPSPPPTGARASPLSMKSESLTSMVVGAVMGS